VILYACGVTVEQAAHIALPEVPALDRAAIEQDIAGVFAQLAPKPLARREPEALLGGVQDSVGHPST
jgi:hypothetical protein